MGAPLRGGGAATAGRVVAAGLTSGAPGATELVAAYGAWRPATPPTVFCHGGPEVPSAPGPAASAASTTNSPAPAAVATVGRGNSAAAFSMLGLQGSAHRLAGSQGDAIDIVDEALVGNESAWISRREILLPTGLDGTPWTMRLFCPKHIVRAVEAQFAGWRPDEPIVLPTVEPARLSFDSVPYFAVQHSDGVGAIFQPAWLVSDWGPPGGII